MPNLGQTETPLKKVHKFYHFWENFDSWRDFTHDEEYDLKEAENRYEKRWMEKENKRLKKELFKKERIRLNRLVNLAQEFDPRLIAERERIEKEKEARKQEILKRKREKREKRELQERLERERIELEKQKKEKARLEHEKAKKLKKESEAAIKIQFKETFLATIKEPKMDSFYADEVIRKLRPDELKTLFESFKSKKITNPQTFKTHLKQIFESRKLALKAKKQAKLDKEKQKKQAVKWTEEESRLLVKGVLKYPAGTHNRWTRVAQFIGGRFDETQVAEYARRLKNVKTKLKNKNRAHVYEVNQKKKVAEEIQIGGNKNKVSETQTSNNHWTQTQQKQLEKALKRHPGSLPVKERWAKIADDVDGKDMKQCVQRFKEIREKIRQKKAK